MSGSIDFLKMHGLGNDFVIVRSEDMPKLEKEEDIAKLMCNRVTGIGADQFIIFNKLNEAVVEMRIYNQDGSKAEACGNASRCIVKIMHEEFGVDNFEIISCKRSLHSRFIKKNHYSVNMGPVSFKEAWMPEQAILNSIIINYGLSTKDVICADIGNPHIIIFSKLSKKDMKILGRDLQKSNIFKNGINVNFAYIDHSQITLRVYERGVGFSLACGSGACCTYASALKFGLITGPASIKFELGDLAMNMIGNDVIMEGPATKVFEGRFFL